MLFPLEALRTLTPANCAWVALVRLAIAAFCGGCIGLERGRKRRPAGFRTHMLVCIGAALAMVLSQYLSMMTTSYWADMVTFSGNRFTDVSRFGAQVINGIGFLGAGTIIVTGHQEVKGLTTAAGLWAAACTGLCVGAGYYEGALLGCVLILATIVLLSRVERWIMARSRNLNIYVQFVNIDDVGAIIAAIKEQGIRILDVDIHKHQSGDLNQSAVFSVRLPKRLHHAVLLSSLAKVENVRAIEEL